MSKHVVKDRPLKPGRLKTIIDSKRRFEVTLRLSHYWAAKNHRKFWNKSRRGRARLHMIKERIGLPVERYFLP